MDLIFRKAACIRLPLIRGGEQHTHPLLRPGTYFLFQLLYAGAHNEFRRADKKAAVFRKGDAAPFCFGCKGIKFPGLPVGIILKTSGKGGAGVIVRIHIIIESRQHFHDRLFREILFIQKNKLVHIHSGFCDGSRFIHTEGIHARQDFHTVHIPDKNLAAGKTQDANGNRDTGKKIQAFGDHADKGRHSRFHSAFYRETHLVLGEEKADSHRHKKDADHADQAVQGTHHFRFG